MKKKLTALLLTGAAVMAIAAGCGKDASSENPSGADPTEQGTVDHVELTVTQRDYSDIVTLGEYKGLEIDVQSADVTDEQLEEAKKSVIASMTKPEQVTDRTVADEDTIHLQYTGYLDGEAFSGGSTGESGTDYTIGGGYIKDLNDQLIGLECGKEYDLDCTFPDDYHNEDLAGKAVVFKVKVDYIHGEDIVPEWNDELVKEYTNGEHTTVGDFEKYMRETLSENNLSQQAQLYEAGLTSTIVEACEISELPEDRVKEITDSYYNYYKYQYTMYAAMYGMEYEAFLKAMNLTDEQLKEMCEEQGKYSTECIVVFSAIAAKEGITVSEEEYNKMAAEELEVSQAGYKTIAEMEAALTQEAIYEDFLNSKIMDFLKEQNNMTISDSSETEAATAE
ncbi:MAG: FKBP-type peptidyl-prolyl cis-trans isomerase [Butyrivibrio sp.]|nr:FKBP-type peptidyl-prolyl cis-trans isomerase [Butyrivibrio sp.]